MANIDKGECPLCKYASAAIQRDASTDSYYVRCPRCGNFGVTDTFFSSFPQSRLQEVGYIFSGVARELTETNSKQPLFFYEDGDKISSHPLVPDLSNPKAKALKLLEAVS